MQLNLTGMKKFALFFLTSIFAVQIVSAQKGELMVKSGDKGLFLEHKVAAKESFYALSRLYNVSPKYLASYNRLDLNKGLQIDQKIRIPLTDTNFTQQGNNGTPVYYKVGDKEGLMTISNKNNKVLLSDLRSWNNLANDEVKEGTKLIIGLLQSKGMTAITISASTKPVIKQVAKAEEKPVLTEPILTKDEKKSEEKEAEAEEKAEKKEEKKKPEPVVIKELPKAVDSGEGYFKSHFERQIKINPVSKNETVTSGIFKTASGWQDGKYYLMIDRVPAGTIIKVINPTNSKAIYAKVLGEMSGIRQNEGLNIRISNAAAAVLQIIEQDKFIMKVSY